jgi:hypothetical protein
VTEGPHLSLEAILLDQLQRFPLPQPELPPEVRLGRADGRTLEPTGPALVVFRVDPGKGGEVRKPVKVRAGAEWEKGGPLPTAGRPVMLRLDCFREGGDGGVRVRIDQRGKEALQVEAAGPAVFLPGRFDATQPFTITLQLQQGSFWLGPHVMVSAKGP